MQLSGTGVDGVALVSAIFGAEDIESECQNAQGPVRKHGARMRIKGAIFDFDGTLFDSMYIWDTAGETYLASIASLRDPA